jgi:uncharacterized protein involved in exopolysaccharide biosynthesis
LDGDCRAARGVSDECDQFPAHAADLRGFGPSPRRATGAEDDIARLGAGAEGYQEFDFLPTELRILQSRALAKRTVQALGIPFTVPPPAAPRTGLGGMYDEVRSSVSQAVKSVIGAPPKVEPPAENETTAEASVIDGFLGGLIVTPVRNTRVVNVAYRSADPAFAARAVNTLAAEYIKQSIELRSPRRRKPMTGLASSSRSSATR